MGRTGTEQPNILVLCMDQWDVHMDLPADVRLPALERLAGAGVSVESQHCTTPQCTPSRSAMWTGQHATTIDMWDNTNFAWTGPLDTQVPTIGTMLREQGYCTAFKGKWHLSDVADSPDALEEHGFSDYQEWGDNWGGPRQGQMLDGTVAEETVDWLRHRRPDDQPWFLVSSMVNPHDVMFLRAGDDEVPHEDGLIAHLAHAPQRLGAFGDPDDVDLPANFHDDLGAQPFGVQSYARNVAWNYGAIPADREDLWKVRRRYLIDCLRLVDRQFQRILDELDRQGLWEDTVVVLTSDHGEMNAAHGLTQKGAIPFQEAALVNLTVVSPDGRRGERSDAVGSHVDLATTFLSWAGLDAEARAARYPQLVGRDLRPVVEGPAGTPGPRGSASQPGDGALVMWDGLNMQDPEWALTGALAAVSQLGDGPAKTSEDLLAAGERFGAPDFSKRTFFRAVSDGRHKLVRWFSPLEYGTPSTVEELHACSDVALYDLAADPGELRNLGDPALPGYDRDTVEAMLGKLNALIAAELGEDEPPFDLDMFGTREVRYTAEQVAAGLPPHAPRPVVLPQDRA